MVSIDGTDSYPPLLHTEDITGPTVFPAEFFHSDELHDEPCEFDTLIFYAIADDLMSTDYYQYNFGDDYFAIYVIRGCSMCGDIEWYDRANYIPMLYTRLVENTPENRYRFYGPEDESSDYSNEEEDSSDDSSNGSNGDSDCSYDPEWEP